MYEIIFSKHVVKDLRRLPTFIVDQIFEQVERLKENPKPTNSKKLKGYTNLYRIRQGDYRIVYTLEDKQLVIEVIKVAHRKDVYRDL